VTTGCVGNPLRRYGFPLQKLKHSAISFTCYQRRNFPRCQPAPSRVISSAPLSSRHVIPVHCMGGLGKAHENSLRPYDIFGSKRDRSLDVDPVVGRHAYCQSELLTSTFSPVNRPLCFYLQPANHPQSPHHPAMPPTAASPLNPSNFIGPSLPNKS
jgi:hypothetical protein